MADVKESALSTANDCAYVRALDSNGNSIRISKADLASVVGGLIKTNEFNPVDWGIFNYYYNGVVINRVPINTSIYVNVADQRTKILNYLVSSHENIGDATYAEKGYIRMGYNGNHATKYKDDNSNKDLLDITVTEEGFLQINSLINTPTFIFIFG